MELEHGGDWAGYEERYGAEPLDFSANTSPLGMPEGARAAAAEALRRADRYPDPLCRTLRRELSAHHGVPAENIVCGAGAADLIHRLAAVLRPKTALIPAPAFSEYGRALEPWGCAVSRHYLEESGGFRPDGRLPEKIVPGLDVLFLCEPNNPTGVTTDPALLRRILERCRQTGTVLVADECFVPFLDEPEKHSLTGELGGGGLVILRAFTKFYGMAGLRLGYCLTDIPGLAEKLASCGPPWAVSLPAQEAGAAALKDRAYAEKLRRLIRDGRPRLRDELGALGYTVIPGEANYLLFRSPDPDLGAKLEREGILLRDCRNFEGLGPGWFRIAVRAPEENERLIRTLGRYT